MSSSSEGLRSHEKAMEYFMETLPQLASITLKKMRGKNHTFSRELLISLLRPSVVLYTPHVYLILSYRKLIYRFESFAHSPREWRKSWNPVSRSSAIFVVLRELVFIIIWFISTTHKRDHRTWFWFGAFNVIELTKHWMPLLVLPFVGTYK